VLGGVGGCPGEIPTKSTSTPTPLSRLLLHPFLSLPRFVIVGLIVLRV
jgi:hypothetical protein